MNQEPNDVQLFDPNKGRGFAIAALVTGLLAIMSMFWIAPGIILGILGIIFALISKKQGYAGGMGAAGLGMSVVGLALSVIFLVACGPLFCYAFTFGLYGVGF